MGPAPAAPAALMESPTSRKRVHSSFTRQACERSPCPHGPGARRPSPCTHTPLSAARLPFALLSAQSPATFFSVGTVVLHPVCPSVTCAHRHERPIPSLSYSALDPSFSCPSKCGVRSQVDSVSASPGAYSRCAARQPMQPIAVFPLSPTRSDIRCGLPLPHYSTYCR